MKRFVRPLAFVSLLVAIVLTGCGKRAEPESGPAEPSAPASSTRDRERAQGVWKVTKMEWPKGSRELSALDAVKSATVTVDGDCITIALSVPVAGHAISGDSEFHLAFADEAQARRVNFVLTEGKGVSTPRTKTVVVTKDDEEVRKEVPIPPLRAIYKFEGDTLVVACAIEPGADRPSVFEPGRVRQPEGLGNESAVVVVHLKKK